ncbi:hypothetical protein HA44_06955 [Mixta gaviniae]|nr:hypothetical protein HA44_06955 [Mixta gaviniae]
MALRYVRQTVCGFELEIFKSVVAMVGVSIVAKTGEVYRKMRFFAPVSPRWLILALFKKRRIK